MNNINNSVVIIEATRFAQEGMSYSDTRVGGGVAAKVGWDGDFYSRSAR